MAQMHPADLGVKSSADPVLDRFAVKLLTEGSGTQIFSTSFAQWAAREALRRAEPVTLLVRFAPRQRQKPMSELLKPSAERPELDPVGSLVDADLSAYYHSLLNKNRMFIVVAGKISKEQLIAKIKSSFANLPAKPYTPSSYSEPVWNDYKVLTEGRELSTNYINGIMNSPPVNSTDYIPFSVGISALSGSLYSELRTRLNLSYDPGANSVMRKMPYALMFISTTSPKDAIPVMVATLNLIKHNNLTNSGLRHLKSSYITNNYIKQQSSSAITESLGQAEIFGGWEMAEQLPDLIDKVTVEQIKTVMNKYVTGLRWSYLGNRSQADEAEDTFKIEVR